MYKLIEPLKDERELLDLLLVGDLKAARNFSNKLRKKDNLAALIYLNRFLALSANG